MRPYPKHKRELLRHGKDWRAKLLRVWQEYEGFYIEVSFETRGPWVLELPSWPWRWVCWFQGHTPEPNEWTANRGRDYCITCKKHL